MEFKKGDIIEWYGDFYEVEENFGDSGIVWALDSNLEKSHRIINFRWYAYGEKCKLIKSS